MSLSSWWKARKERREAEKKEKLEVEFKAEAEEAQPLAETDPGIAPAETRFTEEYKEFLAQQEPFREIDLKDGEQS